MYCSMVMAQLLEWSLLTIEIRGSNLYKRKLSVVESRARFHHLVISVRVKHLPNLPS